MASSDGFIDALGPGVEERLSKYHQQILDLIKSIDNLNNKQRGASTPSSSDSVVRELTTQLKIQDEIIRKLQIDYEKLSEIKRKNNSLSVQQRTDNAILLQQQKQEATIISEVAGAYKKLNAEHARSATNVQNIIARGRTATQTQKQYNAELKKAQNEFNALNVRILKADAAIGKFNRNVGNYPKVLGASSELLGALGVTTGIAGVVALGSAIFNTTKETQSLNLALKQVIGSETQLIETQGFLRRIANQYGQDIQSLTQQYTQFYVSAKDKLGNGEIEAIFESVSKAAGALGLPVEQSTRAFTALNQMLSKGTVSSEELKGQLGEALPGAFGILAKSMGVNEQQLAKLLKDGKVLAAEVLPEFAKQLEKTYGIETLNKIDTLAASQTRFKNSWVELVRTLNENETGGLTQFFSFFTNMAAGALAEISRLNSSYDELRNKQAAQSKSATSNSYGVIGKNEVDVAKEKMNLDKSEANIKAYNDAVDNQRKAIEKVAKTDRENALKDIDKYNKALRKAKQVFAENDQGDLSGFLDLDKVKAQRDATNEMEDLNLSLGRARGKLQAANEVLNKNSQETKVNTTEIKDNKRAIDARNKAIEAPLKDSLKDDFDLQISNIQRIKHLIEQRFDSDVNYADDKIKLSNQIYNKEKEILTLQLFENLRLHKDNEKQQLIDRNNFRTEDEKLEKENQERILKIRTDKFNEYQDYVSKNGRKADEEKFGVGVNYLPTEEMDKMVADYSAFQDKMQAEEDEALEARKKRINDYLESFKKSFFDEAGLPALFDLMSGKIEGFGEDIATTVAASLEVFQEFYNFLSKASSENFDLERANLEKRYQIDLEFAGDNEAAKKELELERERRQKEINQREARANKKLAQFNIAINAAQGIVAAYKDGNIISGSIFAAVIAAVAVAQIAALNSQEVPEYWKGTDDAPGGLAWTQERGREIITDKQGNIKSLGSDGGRVLTKLEKGDKVLTADKTKSLMFDNGLNGILTEKGINLQSVNINNNMDVHVLGDRIESAIARIPQPVFAKNEDGLGRFIDQTVAGQKYHNARLKIIPQRLKR